MLLLLVSPSMASASGCCWCDENTPPAGKTMVGSNGLPYSLVFSDEFNVPGRNFANGHDTKWTALNIGDTSNKGTAFYLPEQASVAVDTNVSGAPVSALLIKTENKSHTGDGPTGETGIYMPYRSAMLQSWNKFCFTGGIVEFRARQPRGGGYWPALWLFGNLGRAVYQDSNTGLWPWSYDECDPDLELPPTDPPQRISACDDHDLATDGLHGYQGRGATELDVLEGAVTNNGVGSYVVGSLQLSPGIPPYFRPPMFGFPTASGPGSWYVGLSFGSGGTSYTDGFANNGWYGPPWGSDCPTGCPDALSGGLVALDDLDSRYWTYRMEWETGPNGHLSWYYDGEFVWAMSASSFGAYSVCSDRGGVKQCSRTPARQIPEEPMSLVMNTAIGTWNGGQTALDGKHWPAKFYVDYVRVWQRETSVGCNPPDYPTKTYIEKNAAFFGELSVPTGYETCPEIYPPSAYHNAARITARAEAARKRTASRKGASAATAASQRWVTAAARATQTLLFTRASTQAAGAGGVATEEAPAAGVGGWLAPVGAGFAVVLLAALATQRIVAARAVAKPVYEPDPVEYEELRR